MNSCKKGRKTISFKQKWIIGERFSGFKEKSIQRNGSVLKLST